MVPKIQLFIASLLSAGILCAAAPDAATPVTNVIFTAFDIETTGFSPKADRIVEIGAVKFRGNGEVLAATNWLLNPGIPVPFYAIEVHGITTEMTANAPVFSEVWPEVCSFCQNTILLAHNATFDISFLEAEFGRNGISPPHLPVGDTLSLFRKWFPDSRSHALGSLCADLRLTSGGYHRAEGDSFHLIDVFNMGIKTRSQISIQQLQNDLGGFKWLDRRIP